jgi:hypothetical protein
MRIKLAILTGIIVAMPMIYGCYVKTNQAKTTDPGDASILQEPMFGLDYSYTRDNVHYDLVPTADLRACPHLSGTEFIYAHAKEGSSDYFVIMGPPPDVVGRGDALGGVLQIQKSHCAEWDSTSMFRVSIPSHGYDDQKSCISSMASSDYKICSRADEKVLRDLVRDGLVRGARAWGAARFRLSVCKPDEVEALGFNPIPDEELVRYCHRQS